MDDLANFFLKFSHDGVIIPFMIMGYIWLNREVFSDGICLILVSIILNYALKVTFKIPLNPDLNLQGYAFPSGHMQSPLVFYGWLAYKFRKAIISLLVSFILFAIGWSLIHMGYHNIMDVIGAIIVGIIWILLYGFVIAKSKNSSLLLIVIAAILAIYIHNLKEISPHIYLVYYALIGFALTESKVTHTKYSNWNKVFSTILCFGSVIGVKVIFTMEIFLSLPIFIYQLHWVFIGCIIPLSGKVIELINAGIFNKS